MQATEQRSMQRHLFEHFSNKDHSGFVDDVFIIFIDKTDKYDPNKRERYWWHKLKTITPQRLNVEDVWFLQVGLFGFLLCVL